LSRRTRLVIYAMVLVLALVIAFLGGDLLHLGATPAPPGAAAPPGSLPAR